MPSDRAHLLFEGQVHSISLKAEVDIAALKAIVPPLCEVREALLEVQVIQLLNLGWLAGRGYNIVAVRVPVSYKTKPYTFTPVLWESEADPVLTGREELGSPKLFANIPKPRRLHDGYAGTASWDGFCFFDYAASDLVAADGQPAPAAQNLLYKYFPRTGDWDQPEVSQFTIAVPGEHPPVALLKHKTGSGRFAFNEARWEDMPTQYSFVNALASLPIAKTATVTVTKIDGIADLRAQRILEAI